MLGIVKEINSEKKIIPLTTDTGTGAPVGTLVSQYKKVPMSGYLYCDGSTFDQNAYPALYMYLGTNVLPDYRECVMVGAEQNTTDTITTHDVYGEGEFKDDQLQSHTHSLTTTGGNINKGSNAVGTDMTSLAFGNGSLYAYISLENNAGGETTHGKQKAVYVYIKATSGLAENQQENVLNDAKNYINSVNSYSTDEVKTGGKWIDGKPIYRKTIYCGALPNNTYKNVNHNITNLDIIIKCYGSARGGTARIVLPNASAIPANAIEIYLDGEYVVIQTGNDRSGYNGYVTVEYTKTTD